MVTLIVTVILNDVQEVRGGFVGYHSGQGARLPASEERYGRPEGSRIGRGSLVTGRARQPVEQPVQQSADQPSVQGRRFHQHSDRLPVTVRPSSSSWRRVLPTLDFPFAVTYFH